MGSVKKSIITAVCLALCVVLPLAFHAIPNAGSIYSPMHIPVLICGLICGWPYGLVCGIFGPVLSWLFTGMPTVAGLPQMVVELAIYGVLSGIMMRFVRTGHLYADLYISLIVAMLSGRIVAGLVAAFLFARGSMSISIFATTYFLTCLPGIVIQLAIIPSVVVALEKVNLIPARYLEDPSSTEWDAVKKM